MSLCFSGRSEGSEHAIGQAKHCIGKILYLKRLKSLADRPLGANLLCCSRMSQSGNLTSVGGEQELVLGLAICRGVG